MVRYGRMAYDVWLRAEDVGFEWKEAGGIIARFGGHLYNLYPGPFALRTRFMPRPLGSSFYSIEN